MELPVTPDDSQTHPAVATSRHDAPPGDATGPTAAAVFAGRILGKYYIAPAIRRGPSLMLRMLQTTGRAIGSGAAKGAPTRSAVQLVPTVDRQSAAPSPRRLLARMPDLSRPAPVFATRLLVQRKPLVSAAGETGAVASRSLGVALTMAQRGATAIAALGADRGPTPANNTATPLLAGHGILVRRSSNLSMDAVAQTGASVGRNVSTNFVLSRHASPMSADGSALLTPSRPQSGSVAGPLVTATNRVYRDAVADPRHVASIAFRSSAPERILASTATLDSVPFRALDRPAGELPIPAASAGVRAGTPPHATSRLGSGLFRRVSISGLQRLVQRKPLTLRRADVPVTAVAGQSFGMRPAVAAGHKTTVASPFSSDSQLPINPGQPQLAVRTHLRSLVQRKPQIGHGASVFTATPAGDGTQLFTTTMPPKDFAYGRGFPDNRTIHARWQPAQAPITHRQALDRPLQAELAQSHHADDALQAPAMTHRTAVSATPQPAAGARPTTAELTLRSARADVNPGPTLVAATLGVAAPAPTPQPANQALGSHQVPAVSSMSIQILADRIFRILERRLVVERERRGIRS